MSQYLPLMVTVIAAIAGSGLTLAFMQRKWAKKDKRERDTAVGTQAILSDGANIRHELWKELGQVKGELKAVQTQQAQGMEERFQLKMSIKALENAEEECKQELEQLKKRVTKTEITTAIESNQ